MVTDEMVSRALAVIMAEPGLSYFDTPEAVAGNRDLARRALEAALGADAGPGQSEEEKIRLLTRAGMENPGKVASIGPDGRVVLSPAGDL